MIYIDAPIPQDDETSVRVEEVPFARVVAQLSQVTTSYEHKFDIIHVNSKEDLSALIKALQNIEKELL